LIDFRLLRRYPTVAGCLRLLNSRMRAYSVLKLTVTVSFVEFRCTLAERRNAPVSFGASIWALFFTSSPRLCSPAVIKLSTNLFVLDQSVFIVLFYQIRVCAIIIVTRGVNKKPPLCRLKLNKENFIL